MKKFQSLYFLFLLSSCFFTANGQVDVVLSKEQVKFINEIHSDKKDFTKVDLKLPITKFISIPIENGKVTMVTTNIRPNNNFLAVTDTSVVVYQDSLIVSSRWTLQSNQTRTFEYNKKNQLKKYGKNYIQYYKNGLPKFFQWGSRSKEYIYDNNCITEVSYGRRENIMEQQTHCFNDNQQIVKDSTWFGLTKDSIPVMIMGYMVTDFEYKADQLIQRKKSSYKGKNSRKNLISKPTTEKDKQLHKKYTEIDTTSSFTTNYFYNDSGLVTDIKTIGFNHNGQNLNKETDSKHIQIEYEFESIKPLVLKIKKINNTLPSNTTVLSFNDVGRLIKMTYEKYSGKNNSGNTLSRTRDFYYDIE